MKQQRTRSIPYILQFSILFFIVTFAGPSLARVFFVNGATGTDAGICTLNPCKSISYAVSQANSGTLASPDIINVTPWTYSFATTGESFPITFNNDYVILQRDGNGQAIIDAFPATNNALLISAMGITIDGFIFRNADDAIYAEAGGLTVTDNTFESSVANGVYLSFSETDYSSDYVLEDILISNNDFYANNDGIYFFLDLDFDNTTPVTVTLGNLTISNNDFEDNSDSIEIHYYLISEIYNGTITVGNFILNDNIFTDQSDWAMDLDLPQVEYLSGTTMATIGTTTISGNNILSDPSNTGADGIGIDPLWDTYELKDTVQVTRGNLTISDNVISVYDTGIDLDTGDIDYLGSQATSDTVKVTTGAITVDNNKITSQSSYGLYLDLAAVDYSYANSIVTVAPLVISNNTIDSDYEGIYLEIDYGSNVYDFAKVLVGSTTITNNTITSAGEGIYFYYYEVAYYSYDNSSVTIAPVIVSNNTVNSDDEAFYLYYEYAGYEMVDNSSLKMDPVTVSDNTFSSTDDNAMYLYFYYYSGSYLDDNATVTLPSHSIAGNTFDTLGGDTGLYIEFYDWPYYNYGFSSTTLGPMTITNNIFNQDKNPGMSYGIYLEHDNTGYDLYNSSQAYVGELKITDNTFYRMSDYALYLYFYDLAYDLYDEAGLTMANIDISNNRSYSTPYGLYFYLSNYAPDDEAKLTFGTISIVDNSFNDIKDYGIDIEHDLYNDVSANAMVNIGTTTIDKNMILGDPGGASATSKGINLRVSTTPTVIFAPPDITGDTITALTTGIELYGLEEANISCNVLQDNSKYGLSFLTNGSFTANHNIFENNSEYALYIADANTASVNAEKNWWNDPAGPAACSTCNGIYMGGGSVDYDPWLTARPPKSLCGDFPWPMFLPAITGPKK